VLVELSESLDFPKSIGKSMTQLETISRCDNGHAGICASDMQQRIGGSELVLPWLGSLWLQTAQAMELLAQCKANKSSEYYSM
jgi:hypothetical protein